MKLFKSGIIQDFFDYCVFVVKLPPKKGRICVTIGRQIEAC